ncbi:hypothetical protein CEUSTIGMA_g9067.t1 [Chlamydomonas eustigma]|uniref:Uncharacterized protein n=1 Tax=Chlamydomonas eustigma TaxID=1157962 RepID=A0A250XFF2_9CHLO|nr:hypothetical protein CEUSTIGMA_g9067.t1 [Chlamydomonas eustigma]|eukprot:GAX81639.1 hypothetical protein CEUSTIGMA_g9067.t1 [Chlamydomonas eustigma]
MNVRAFQPTPEKVRQVEIHPVQPWLASSTKDDRVYVWDWHNQQMIAEFQLGGGEDELLIDIDIQKANLNDSQFTVNPSLEDSINNPTTSRSSTGKVRDIKFLDMEVAQVQLSAQDSLVNGLGSISPSAEHISTLRGRRSLLIVCESKIVVLDLLTKKVEEVAKSALEGKSATCASFLFLGGQALPGAANGTTVMRRPAVAVGLSDGTVKILQHSSWQLIMRLVSTHKSSIQCIATFQSRGVPWEQVVVGHSYGSLASWEPFSHSLSQGGDMSCKSDCKAHDKEVVGMALMCVQEAVEGKRTLYTAGVDNRLMGWDPVTLKELSKSKLDSKAQTTCMTLRNGRGFVASGAHTILVGTEIGVLLSLHAPSGSMRLVCNLAGLLPQGQKKAPKIYWVAAHPLRPQFTAVGINTGTALLTTEELPPPLPATPLPLRSPLQAHAPLPQPLPATPLPLRSPLQAHAPLPQPADVAASSALLSRSMGAGTGLSYLVAVGDKIVCATCSTSEQEVQQKDRKASVAASVASALDSKATASRSISNQLDSLITEATPSQPVHTSATTAATTTSAGAGGAPTTLTWKSAQITSLVKVTEGKPSQRAVITASFDGSYVAVVWPVARQYSLFRSAGPGLWEELAGGPGKSVAWHSSLHRFAVLHDDDSAVAAAAAADAAAAKKVKGSTGPGKSNKSGRPEIVDRSLSSASNVPGRVEIKEVSSRSVMLIHSGLKLSATDRPTALFCGPLLSVVFKQRLQDSDLQPGEEGPSAMQMFAWDNASKVGPVLQMPQAMAWDPSLNFLAMAYSSQLLICSVKPTFKAVSSLPMEGVTDLQWASRQLYILTDTGLHLVFVALPNANQPLGTAPPIHMVTLASFGDGMVPPPSTLLPPRNTCLLPQPMARPGGMLRLLGPRDGFLWLMNHLGQPLALQLGHPGLTAMSLVASGYLPDALAIARQQLAPEVQDVFAAFVVDMEGVLEPGIASALLSGLPELGLVLQAKLHLQLRSWQRAMDAIEGLLQGSLRPPTLNHTSSGMAGASSRGSETAARPFTESAFGNNISNTSGLLPEYRNSTAQQGSGNGGALEEGLFVGATYGNAPSVNTSAISTSITAWSVPPSAQLPLPHKEELDWTLPLRQALGGQLSPRDHSASRQSRGTAMPSSGGENQAAVVRSAAVEVGLDLGLKLMEGVVSSGMVAVAQQVARLLLVMGGSLLGEARTVRLLLLVVQARLGAELAEEVVAAGGVGRGGPLGASGIEMLAAALSGQPYLLSETLQQRAASGGLGAAAGLASLHASAHSLPSSGTALAAWKVALAKSVSGVAAPHFTVSTAVGF